MNRAEARAKELEAKFKGNPDRRGSVEQQLDWLQKIMFALIVVLFLGFAAMFAAVGQMMYDSLKGKQASYTELQRTVEAQDDKIEVLTESINNLTKALQDEQKAIQKTN
jgi:peptidoglycan hydrolase CwlO-like protein